MAVKSTVSFIAFSFFLNCFKFRVVPGARRFLRNSKRLGKRRTPGMLFEQFAPAPWL
jgi:hypothetical protein